MALRVNFVALPHLFQQTLLKGSGEADTELAGFLQIGMGSASEVEYHVLLARDLNLLSQKIYEDLDGRIVEVKKMLSSLLMKVRRDR